MWCISNERQDFVLFMVSSLSDVEREQWVSTHCHRARDGLYACAGMQLVCVACRSTWTWRIWTVHSHSSWHARSSRSSGIPMGSVHSRVTQGRWKDDSHWTQFWLWSNHEITGEGSCPWCHPCRCVSYRSRWCQWTSERILWSTVVSWSISLAKALNHRLVPRKRNWDAIRANAQWIVQLHSPSDKLIPVAEGRFVADKLKSEYLELERRGHFMGEQLPELIKVIKKKCATQWCFFFSLSCSNTFKSHRFHCQSIVLHLTRIVSRPRHHLLSRSSWVEWHEGNEDETCTKPRRATYEALTILHD